MLRHGLGPKCLQLGGLLAYLVFSDVGDVEHRLSSEEGKAFEKFRLLWLEAQGPNRFPLVEVGRQPVKELELLLLLGAGLESRGGADPLSPLVDHIEVGQRQLEVDHPHVPAWVELAIDVLNVRILEGADHHRQRVELADIREKLDRKSTRLNSS